MKIKELRELNNEEIGSKRRDLKQDALTMRVQQASGQLENPSRLKVARRDVARLETILSERRLNLSVGKKATESAAAAKPKAAKKAAAKKAPAKKAAKKSAE